MADNLKQRKMIGGELLDDLRSKYNNYEALKYPDKTNHPKISSESKQILFWVNKLGIKIVFPVLMAGLEKYSKEDFTRLSDITLRWFFRVKTVANKNASALEVELAKIAYKILHMNLPLDDFKKKETKKDEKGKEVEEESTFDGVKSKLSKSSYNISDNVFESNLAEISLGRYPATYVLTKIIEKQQNRKIIDMIPSDNITLEHIMPQQGIEKKTSLPKLKPDGTIEVDGAGIEIKENYVWLDYIKKNNSMIDDRDALSFHQNYQNRLGNLTLVDKRKNSSLGTHPFVRKCDAGKDKKGVEKGCFKNSNIQITKDILNWKEWNKDSIEKRQVILAKIARDIWKI